jgi:hypothetical protein
MMEQFVDSLFGIGSIRFVIRDSCQPAAGQRTSRITINTVPAVSFIEEPRYLVRSGLVGKANLALNMGHHVDDHGHGHERRDDDFGFPI